MAAGFERIFHIAALQGVDSFYERGERASDSIGDHEDEQGAGDDSHEAQAEKEAIEALEIAVGFAVRLQNDDVRGGLQAGSEFDGAGVIALVTEG